MSRWGRHARPPPGYEYIEPVMTALENELREKVNEPHEGKRKKEALWPIHQINWQRSRYVYDMYYVYKKISKEVYDYCVRMKLVDTALIAKWKKPGYERLCSTFVINPKNYKFGTVSICRVPKQFLAEGTLVEDQTTGCRGCASGQGGEKNIFGNKYGQYLAAIQIARENRDREAAAEEKNDDDDSDHDVKSDDSDDSEVKKRKKYTGRIQENLQASHSSIWASLEEEQELELPTAVTGSQIPKEQMTEARKFLKNQERSSKLNDDDDDDHGPPQKKHKK